MSMNIATRPSTPALYDYVKVISPLFNIKQNDSIAFSCVIKTKNTNIFAKAELIVYASDGSTVVDNSKTVTFNTTTLGENTVSFTNYLNTWTNGAKVCVSIQCYANDTLAGTVGGIEIKNPQLVVIRS
ncbi:hypothetical protein [Clostridium gasigenes]|uniref:hypothetical protein n=1 Tax=Clostridium gasigenes TaxID=94869 RepID=UPI001C0BAB0A|nr:hypothetical protein [Clostridium gasigenes]MBU3109899.1 hypothetical protein [Clostridium gasigenes]